MAAPTNTARTAYLRLSERGHQRDWQKQSRLVTIAGGPGPWRQLWDLIRLRLARSDFAAEDYYRFGIWKGGVGRANLSRFLPESGRQAYNFALHDAGFEADLAAARAKLETEARLVAAGLPCVRTRAAVNAAVDLPPGVSALSSAAELAEYLTTPEAYPMFVKPVAGSFASGTAAFDRCENGVIHLSNGLEAPLEAVVDEMMAEPEGYLIQPPVAAASDLARHAGRAMPSLRITTIRLQDGVVPWYAALRLPAVTQMSDGGSVNLRVWSEIDLDDGRALRWRRVGSPHNTPPDHWADKDTPLSELRVSSIKEAAELTVVGHGAFPKLGVIGWDVFVTDAGPLLNEANGNPFPVLQSVRGDGLRTGAPEKLYQQALAAAQRR